MGKWSSVLKELGRDRKLEVLSLGSAHLPSHRILSASLALVENEPFSIETAF